MVLYTMFWCSAERSDLTRHVRRIPNPNRSTMRICCCCCILLVVTGRKERYHVGTEWTPHLEKVVKPPMVFDESNVDFLIVCLDEVMRDLGEVDDSYRVPS